MAEEQLKYWGLTLTEFDRVLVLDADTMVLDPMDELIWDIRGIVVHREPRNAL